MQRFRNLFLFSARDGALLAQRFPRCAYHVIRDAVRGVRQIDFPRRLGLFLTDRCNFACEMCAVGDVRAEGLARGGDIEFDVVQHVLAECAAHQPVLDLIGGEPLLYPRINDAVRIASRKVVATLTTNGLRLEQHAEAVIEARLPILQVSLDGWDEPSQTKRGHVRASFERLVRGVQAVLKARGNQPFPIVRILTAITRNNYAHLDRIHSVVAELGVKDWGISNYFYLNPRAFGEHQIFALQHSLPGSITAHAVNDDVYLDREQVAELKNSLARVKQQSRRLKVRIAYAWDLDLDSYYSARTPSPRVCCELPYNRLDIHTDGQIAICVSGKRLGRIGRDSIADVWKGNLLGCYRKLYERTRPMPMCFRCCGLSQRMRFD